MSKKTLAPYRAPPKPSSKTLARQTDAMCERVFQFFADTPALTAASALSAMLAETADPATRLAILTARIQVLRARTVACRSGKPVNAELTLGAMLAEQKSEPPAPDPTPEVESVQPEAPEEPSGAPEAVENAPPEALAKIKLLQSYEHAGITLPEGAVFEVSPVKAEELVAKGISILLSEGDQPESVEDQVDDASNDTSGDEDTRPAE